MQTYFALVHRQSGAAYGVNFPDLPGCFAASDEEADLFDAAREALSLYVEGLDAVPAARTLEQLLSDPAVAEEIDAGGVILGVPLLLSERKTRVNVMLNPALLAGIDQTSRVVGINRSEFIAEAVKDRLQKDLGAAIATRDRYKRAEGGSAGHWASNTAASAAARVMKSKTASKAEKSVAASALTQKGSTETTGKKVASAAAKVLKDPKASKDAKSAAASALTQKSGSKSAPDIGKRKRG